jgi:uncharacterized membrane protein YjfL (UPF0719 family)
MSLKEKISLPKVRAWSATAKICSRLLHFSKVKLLISKILERYDRDPDVAEVSDDDYI